MSSCCHTGEKKKPRTDYLLVAGSSIVAIGYLIALLFSSDIAQMHYLHHFTVSTFELMNKMWWGIMAGILFVGLLDRIPREFVVSILGRKRGLSGILRATTAGVALDLCSHGILLVGMKLYERGASLGQTMAFLIASPWNSLSITLILWSLIGFKWMMAFLLLSVVIAVISGLIFERLVDKGVLPDNPNKIDIADDFRFFKEAKKQLKQFRFTPFFVVSVVKGGFKSSGMILRWIFVGIIITALLRTFVPAEMFQSVFGPTIAGLFFTLLVATVIEVCSEGSTPIAAEIMTRAGAAGNSFAFLMSGVATDYTEILALKETTKSWKIAFFLPLVTLPQVVLLSVIMNGM